MMGVMDLWRVAMNTVGQMTKDELREMIETIIEQKLLELLGDPDEGRHCLIPAAADRQGRRLSFVVRRIGKWSK